MGGRGSGSPGEVVMRARVAIWGRPGSGKATFLSALPRAAARHHHSDGHRDWAVSGSDDARLRLRGEWRDETRRRLRKPPKGAERAPVEILLDVADIGGQVLHLAGYDGIVYLFDPIFEPSEEMANRDVLAFDDSLHRLYDKAAADGRVVGGALPHFLSVCVTKFDDPGVFALARRGNFVLPGEPAPQPPRVPDTLTVDFFRAVCRDSPNQAARVIADGIRSHFQDERVKYFATSSTGFRENRIPSHGAWGGTQQWAANPPPPVNVLEPLIWAARGARRRNI
jgi:hypothetical protein